MPKEYTVIGQLTDRQIERVQLYLKDKPNARASEIACKLSLTREYVVRYLTFGQ